MTRPRLGAHRKRHKRDVKDRLVQTRVPEQLETKLKEEAKKRRLSVSHLIRNVLEDTLHLVDTVVSSGEELAHESVRIAEQVARDASRIASTARGFARNADDDAAEQPSEPQPQEEPAPAAGPAQVSLDHVLAWNAVVLNRDVACASCGRALVKGSPAHLGISSDPTRPTAWLCPACLVQLQG